jgi:hypothetical protein
MIGLVVAMALVSWPAVGAARPQDEYPRTQTYTDATADSGSAADISTVAVTLDARDALTFTLSEANRTSLVAPDSLAILIDADENSATGAPGGAEYQVLVEPTGVKLLNWGGTAFVDSPSEELTASSSNGKVTVHVRCEDLGFPEGIAFVVQTSVDGLATVGDSAPDVLPGWSFALETTAKVTAGALRLSKARAGQVFTASMPVSVSYDPAPLLQPASMPSGAVTSREEGTTTCLATVGGRPLRAIGHSFSNNRASCAWRLAKLSRGKVLRGRIRVELDEGSVSRTFALRIQ